jgi:phosphohistidine phosphatase
MATGRKRPELSMLTLMLLRHAKSSWAESGLTDIERPLAPRGKSAARSMGGYLRSHRFKPALVLCSPARRTRDTWELVLEELKEKPVFEIEQDLYDFGDGTRLLQCLRKRNDAAKSIMIVGHNPALEELAQRLIASGDEKLRSRLEKKYPTGALAVIELPGGAWQQLTENSGKLIRFVRPKDIVKEER